MTGYTPEQREAALAELARLYRVLGEVKEGAHAGLRAIIELEHARAAAPPDQYASVSMPVGQKVRMKLVVLIPGLDEALAVIVERERELHAEEHAHENPDAGQAGC